MKKSNYAGLWLLLATALIIVLTVAFSDDISLGSYTIKKAPFRESLLTDHDAEVREAAQQDSILAVRREEQEKREKEVHVDSTSQSILLIGDSMTLNLAYRLAQYAKHNGHTFHSVNWDSSGTVKWGKSRHLEEFIKEYGATYVFISLGSNELYIKDPKSHLKYIESILEQVGDRPYVWIGPPNWKEDFGINDLLEATCVPGGFFRSAGMEFERKKDGIHPTREASALWIDSIARWMHKSSHPIIMDTPPDSIGKVSPNVKYMKATDK
ncbi:MAG: hypothetical protein K2M56_08895 [Muribaculaceae bacterium]|nr:hypothetical protein [Muribaculaceae bacterium]